jgi:hypothetical protein
MNLVKRVTTIQVHSRTCVATCIQIVYAQQGLEEGSGGDSLFPHHGFQNTTQATQQKMNMCTIIEFYCTPFPEHNPSNSTKNMNMYFTIIEFYCVHTTHYTQTLYVFMGLSCK